MCLHVISPAQAQTADETAIRSVLEASIAAFHKRDLHAFSAQFAQSPDLYYQVTDSSAVLYAHGWAAMTRMVGGWMQQNPQPGTVQDVISDYRVQVRGATACVHALWETEQPGKTMQPARVCMVLEKQQGAWKILSSAVHYHRDGQRMEVK